MAGVKFDFTDYTVGSKGSIIAGPKSLVDLATGCQIKRFAEFLEVNSPDPSNSTKMKVAEKIFKAIEEKGIGTKAPTRSRKDGTATTPRGESKKAKLITALQQGPTSVDDLMEASGFDRRNTLTAISILKNKDGLTVNKDENGLYSLEK